MPVDYNETEKHLLADLIHGEFHWKSKNNERHSNCKREHNPTDPDFMDKHASTVSPVPSNEHLLCLLRENELN